MAAYAAVQRLGVVPPRVRSAPKGRREIARGILLGMGAAAAGALFGLVASPGPDRNGASENLAWTTAAAIDTAQRSEQRARTAEKALAQAREQLQQLDATGVLQELYDWREAQRLGLDRALNGRGGFSEDEKRQVLAAIVRESRRHGLDPVMVAAVIEIESRFDPFARSDVGACGLMQLMPPTAKELLAERDARLVAPRHLFNPVLNIELGTAYIARLLQRFDGDLQRALIAYNAGPSVARSLVRGTRSYRRLQAYPRAVLTTYRSFLLAQQEGSGRLAQG
jgi:soluble lytic murein transglycosylase